MLAIVIPYYKLTFFRETLASLAAQTDKRFHVYIGDDASPEDPGLLLEEYKGRFGFAYKRFDQNLGGESLTKQWERCIAMTRGEEWLLILGDDDLLGKNAIEMFHQNITEAGKLSNVVRYATQLIDENSQPISDIYYQPKFENAIDSYFRKQKGENRSSLSEHVFRTSQVLKQKFRNFPLGWCSDDFAVLDFSAGKPIYSLNDELVYVRISTINISGQKTNNKIKAEAIEKSTYTFIKDYHHKIPADKKIFYIKLYDHLILKSPRISLIEFLHMQYLTVRYADCRMAFNQWKTVIYRLINNSNSPTEVNAGEKN